MCQDQVVPNFQEIHSPVSIPYPASVLPPTQESRSSGLPRPPNLTTRSIPGVILASPLTPREAAVPPPTHTNKSYLVRPIEWDGRRPTAAQKDLRACFPDVRPDTNAPPQGKGGGMVRACGTVIWGRFLLTLILPPKKSM